MASRWLAENYRPSASALPVAEAPRASGSESDPFGRLAWSVLSSVIHQDAKIEPFGLFHDSWSVQRPVRARRGMGRRVQQALLDRARQGDEDAFSRIRGCGPRRRIHRRVGIP